jgi:hypothetical protein
MKFKGKKRQFSLPSSLWIGKFSKRTFENAGAARSVSSEVSNELSAEK